MTTLFVLYSALAVFGLGVTVVDLFGALDHAGQGQDTNSDDDGGSDTGAHGDDASSDASDDDSADVDDGSEDDSGQADDQAADQHDESDHDAPARGSLVMTGERGTRAVAKAIGVLRTGVYFSLGAGPTGLFALWTGVPAAASLAWSAGAGAFIAVLARSLRSFIRKDLDSSIKPEEFLMDTATISVSVAPGAMGKAVVRRYGKETELYVRCKDPAASLPKGTEAVIVDWDDECYWVERRS